MQTLYELHQDAKLAHLDLSLANIMLVSDATNSWDKLRLLDFGLSEPFQPSGTADQCLPDCAIICIINLGKHNLQAFQCSPGGLHPDVQ